MASVLVIPLGMTTKNTSRDVLPHQCLLMPRHASNRRQSPSPKQHPWPAPRRPCFKDYDQTQRKIQERFINQDYEVQAAFDVIQGVIYQ